MTVKMDNTLNLVYLTYNKESGYLKRPLSLLIRRNRQDRFYRLELR